MASGIQICCPLCREKTRLRSPNLATELFTNFAILNLIDALQDVARPLPDTSALQLEENNIVEPAASSGEKGDKSCDG